MPRVASALDNCGLVAALVAVVAAQALKPLTARVAGGAWRPALALASGGGFPSSHSAFVSALRRGRGRAVGVRLRDRSRARAR